MPRIGRNAGYVYAKPPHELTEAADIQNYFTYGKGTSVNPDLKQNVQWATFYLLDSEHNRRGRCVASLHDLRETSGAVAEIMRDNRAVIIEVTASKTTVLRYIECISPRKKALPQFDFDLLTVEDENGETQTAQYVHPIEWDFKATVELYILAAGLVDDFVCDLIMDHWQEALQQGNFELEQECIEAIFESTEDGDTARQFWVDVLKFEGCFSEEDDWHPGVVEMMKDQTDIKGTAPWALTKSAFRRKYQGRTDKDLVAFSKLRGSEAPDFNQIASRLLRTTKKFTEEDQRRYTKRKDRVSDQARELAVKFQAKHEELVQQAE
jgi:hypothetical protein